jgi:Ran GTPase-activating protein (RanGAP) involved in mRNA processing and transport
MTPESPQDKFSNYIEQLKCNNPSITKTICIDNFTLTSRTAKELIDALKHNEHVKTLCINGNWIKVGRRGFMTLAQYLHRTKTIKTVNLYGEANINMGAFIRLARRLKLNKSITELNVSWEYICPKILELLLKTFEYNKGLTKFTFQMNAIQFTNDTDNNYNSSVEACEKIGMQLNNILINDKVLNTMTLFGSTIPYSLATWFANGLRHNTTITELLLSQLTIDDCGIMALIDGALRFNHTVTVFSLAATRVSYHVAKRLADILCFSDCSLRSLDVSRCSLCPHGMIAIVNALRFNKSIQIINLNNNTMTLESAQALATLVGLSDCPLIAMDLSSTSLCTPGMIAIIKALKFNQSIQTIKLNNNKIELESAAALATVLDENRVLQHVYTNYCSIGDAEVRVLATSLERNHTVQILELSGNFIADNGVELIANLLEYHPSLQRILLKGNDYTAVGLSRLLTAMRYNSKLIVLGIPEDLLTDAREHESELLSYNDTLQKICTDEDETYWLLPISRTAPLKRRRAIFESIGPIRRHVLGESSLNESFRELEKKNKQFLVEKRKRLLEEESNRMLD